MTIEELKKLEGYFRRLFGNARIGLLHGGLELREHLLREGIVAELSRETLRRILRDGCLLVAQPRVVRVD